MKNDLVTAIGSAIAGLVLAFIITGFFKGEIEPFTVKTIEDSVNVELADPSPEIFNYRALNSTVEVYIGICTEYDAKGDCVEAIVEEETEDLEGLENLEEQED